MTDDLTPPQVKAALDASGHGYRVVPCDPDHADTAVFIAEHGIAADDSANCLLITSKTGDTQLVACVVLATTRLDVNRVVRKKMGAKKCSFADPELTKELTGMELGGVTPFGLPAGLPVWVDARVMERDEIVLGGGDRNSKLFIAPGALRSIPSVEVVEGLAKAAD